MDAFVIQGASRAEVVQYLGEGCHYFERGAGSGVVRLGSTPPASLFRWARPRKLMEQYPRAVHHTTFWTQTWAFFDNQDRIRAYFFDSQ